MTGAHLKKCYAIIAELFGVTFFVIHCRLRFEGLPSF